MRNTLIIGGICILAIVIGAWLYFGTVTVVSPSRGVSPAPSGRNVSFTVLDKGINAKAMPSRKNYAIYTSGEFADFWKRAHGTATAVPLVNFTKNYVIGVFAGTEPSSGYAIKVTNITDTDDTRSVTVTLTEPGVNCSTIEEPTSPYEFIVVPASSAQNLSHTDQAVTQDCPK